MPGVLEDVDERSPHFARSLQRPRVIAIGEHGAAAGPEPIQRARDAHEQALHPARERMLIGRLGDEMDVVRLHGVLGETESESLGPCAKRALDPDPSRVSSQARQARA
jgi:hypothetical protein